MNMPDPRNHDKKMNIVVLADWGPSYKTGYTPIHQTLRNTMSYKKMDLMVVVGDIAYNLNSEGGKMYT